MSAEHRAALGSLRSSLLWPFTWVFAFLLSNLFPSIIMTQRRVVTSQTPFGWILMRDLNHSDKWKPSAWLVVEGRVLVGGKGKPCAEPVLCPGGLYTWSDMCMENLAILGLDDEVMERRARRNGRFQQRAVQIIWAITSRYWTYATFFSPFLSPPVPSCPLSPPVLRVLGLMWVVWV